MVALTSFGFITILDALFYGIYLLVILSSKIISGEPIALNTATKPFNQTTTIAEFVSLNASFYDTIENQIKSIDNFDKMSYLSHHSNDTLEDEKVFSMKKAVRKVIKKPEVVSEVTTQEVLRYITRRDSEVTTELDMNGPCRIFVEGTPDQNEFYSPGHPQNYPNLTDCVKMIDAPPGHLLRLDFRDEFHLEPSEDCKFDYLEVRDGAHGYSNLIGKFCGHEFPPMLTSSDRYLWLRFVSDESIQYSGFRAVYSFVPKPTNVVYTPEVEMCRIEVSGSEGYANKSQIDENRIKLTTQYGIPLDCMWVITVEEGWRIMLTFSNFNLDKPNDCDSNFIDIFSDRTDIPSRVKLFCGSIADAVQSVNNILHLRFFAEARAINSNFDALFTAYREKKRDEVCLPDEYDCEDATCIAGDLRCNGNVNCRFRWDEAECELKLSSLAKIISSEHIILILVVFFIILFGMCFAFVFNCSRKLIKDHRIIQEHMRQLKENQEENKKQRESVVQATLQKIATLSNHTRSNSSSVISVQHDLDNSHHSKSPAQRKRLDEDCYVPGGEIIPIFTGAHSEDNQDYDGDIDTMDDTLAPLPEMRDNECQTRESLFSPQFLDHTPTPPPITARKPNSASVPFSTFGYTERNNRRYRAEAVIEMENKNKNGEDSSTSAETNDLRPFSIDSTKSAPDVIVTH